jgi:hypothetical protein
MTISVQDISSTINAPPETVQQEVLDFIDFMQLKAAHSQALSTGQQSERFRQTQEALADVDAGRVTDQQTVQAWADSLSSNTPLPVPR